MNSLRSVWKKRLKNVLIPAVPVPFKKDGSVDWVSQKMFIKYIKAQPIEGVAVWAHTGRGLFLDRETRKELLALWRSELPKNLFIVAGVGARKDESLSDREYLKKTEAMLQDALDNKAELVMPYAPVQYRDNPSKERKILEYYGLIARAKIPFIFFYLYEAAGGIEYSLDFLARLLERENIVGIKIATLDSVMRFQDIAALLRKKFPDIILITGEDRFLPYSFQMGAQAALIGMGSVFTSLQKKMIRAWTDGRFKEFHKMARKVDDFSRTIFTRPMEGYIQRLLYVLARLRIIRKEAIFDPFGPKLPKDDFQRIDKVLSELRLL